jgi:hypothetical protein
MLGYIFIFYDLYVCLQRSDIRRFFVLQTQQFSSIHPFYKFPFFMPKWAKVMYRLNVQSFLCLLPYVPWEVHRWLLVLQHSPVWQHLQINTRLESVSVSLTVCMLLTNPGFAACNRPWRPHRIVRRWGSHIIYKIGSQMAIPLSAESRDIAPA